MKSMAKKVVAVVLAVGMVFSLAACQGSSEKSVQSTVKSSMKAIKKYNDSKIKKSVDSATFDAIRENLDLLEDGNDLLKVLFTQLEFEVGEAIVDKDPGIEDVSATATCDVVITNRDIQTASSTYLLNTIAALRGETIDLTDKDYQKKEVATIVEKLKSESVATKEWKVQMNLEKRKGKWIIVLAGAAESAVFGGASASIQTILSYIKRANNGQLNFGAVNTTSPEEKTSEHPTTPTVAE